MAVRQIAERAASMAAASGSPFMRASSWAALAWASARPASLSSLLCSSSAARWIRRWRSPMIWRLNASRCAATWRSMPSVASSRWASRRGPSTKRVPSSPAASSVAFAQGRQAIEDVGRAVDGIAAGRAVVGVGRGEQRVLLAGDEAVDQVLDAMRIDVGRVGRRRRRVGRHHPVGDVEADAHRVASGRGRAWRRRRSGRRRHRSGSRSWRRWRAARRRPAPPAAACAWARAWRACSAFLRSTSTEAGAPVMSA